MSKVESDVLKGQPIDKIDKNLRHMFGLLTEKNWNVASALADKMSEGPAEIKQMAEGFKELIGFLKNLSAGRELKAAIKYLDSIIINDELENLLPKMEGDDLLKLKEDIEKNGVITPLIVQETPEGLLLIDGYTRYRISEELGKTKVPVVSISNVLDPRTTALMINLTRRHMSKEQRDAIIKAFPVPKVGRPKKGEAVISKKEIAKELGISEDTVQRARNPKKGANASISKRPKLKKICTPPDKVPDSIAPITPSDEGLTGVNWFPVSMRDPFRKAGYMKGIGYEMKFTKEQVNYDWLVKNTENCMKDLLKSIKDAGLEDEVDFYRMTVSFDARKKEVKE